MSRLVHRTNVPKYIIGYKTMVHNSAQLSKCPIWHTKVWFFATSSACFTVVLLGSLYPGLLQSTTATGVALAPEAGEAMVRRCCLIADTFGVSSVPWTGVHWQPDRLLRPFPLRGQFVASLYNTITRLGCWLPQLKKTRSNITSRHTLRNSV